MVIQQPSAALLQLLDQESHAASGDPVAPAAPVLTASRPPRSGGSPPIVRGQNY